VSSAITPPPTRGIGRTVGRVARGARMFGTDLSHPPLPARGMFLSVLVHTLFLLFTLVVPWSYWIPAGPRLVAQEEQMREQPLILPTIQPMGGGHPSAASPGGGQGRAERHAKPAPANKAKAEKGVVFKGPQLIVSNPKRPDNYRQTILQPDLIKAPTLPVPLPIPPIVSVAAAAPVLQRPAEPAPAPKAPVPVPVLPLSVSQELPKVEAPKLPLPAAQTQTPLQAVAKTNGPSAGPKLAPGPVPVEGQTNGTHNLLVVNALPTNTPLPTEIPPGELHGSFTVSPIGTNTLGTAGGGALETGAPGNESGTVGGSYAGAGTATEGPSGAGSGAGNGPASGNVAGTGSGSGAGIGNGGTGHGTGTGTGTMAGTGSGEGHGSGGGKGGGKGSGASPFPEVMIQGSGAGNSPAGSGRSTFGISFGPRSRGSYNITIVANGASGGGFPDYGIFRNDTSYTVYLDMSDKGLAGQSWPMQYAVDRSDPEVSADLPQGAPVVAPFPAVKVLPSFDPELAAKVRGRKVVVLGTIDQGGGWETTRILQSPDARLNAAVVDALRKWIFRPAEMNGSPVSVKCLLGVTVNPPRR
jgi:TonB family protein